MKAQAILFLSSVLTIFSSPVWAGDAEDQRIISAAKPVTVAVALKAAKDTPVQLTGTIVVQVKHEHYQLKDQTGVINVEIDDDLASAAQLKNGTKVRVIGEVDTHRYKAKDIDVVKVDILK